MRAISAHEPTLADAVFDYPSGADGGWRFFGLDRAHREHPMAPAEESADRATPLAYLRCSGDPHCLIGRDFVHPGHECRPSLAWRPQKAARYYLEVDAALARAETVGGLRVELYRDAELLCDSSVNFPDRTALGAAFFAQPETTIRVVFAAVGSIENVFALFSARIVADGAALSGDDRAPTSDVEVEVSVSRSPSWLRVEAMLQAAAPPGVPPEQIWQLVRHPFRGSPFPPYETVLLSRALLDQHFGATIASFRASGHFAVKDSERDANAS